MMTTFKAYLSLLAALMVWSCGGGGGGVFSGAASPPGRSDYSLPEASSSSNGKAFGHTDSPDQEVGKPIEISYYSLPTVTLSNIAHLPSSILNIDNQSDFYTQWSSRVSDEQSGPPAVNFEFKSVILITVSHSCQYDGIRILNGQAGKTLLFRYQLSDSVALCTSSSRTKNSYAALVIDKRPGNPPVEMLESPPPLNLATSSHEPRQQISLQDRLLASDPNELPPVLRQRRQMFLNNR